MHKECFRAINKLRKNDDIITTKPDKGSGVVLLNKSDYVNEMNKILDDQSRFKRLGSVSSNDNTASIESRATFGQRTALNRLGGRMLDTSDLDNRADTRAVSSFVAFDIDK